MRRITLALGFLFLGLSQIIALGKEKEVVLQSKIQQVTIFSKGAQVFRVANTTIPEGRSYLKFTGISPHIIKQSVQVKGKGDFTILSVNHQINHFVEPNKSTKVEQLEAEKLALQEKLDIEGVLFKVLGEEESLILTNKAIGGQQTGVSISELKAAAAFYNKRLTEIRLKKLAINKTINEYRTAQNKIKNQLQALHADQGVYTSEVVIAIVAKRAGAANFTLNYLVQNAGWFPTYDIRVKDVKTPIDLSYKANVFQTSGEDWSKVKLNLSTGNPYQTGQKPKMAPWLLRFYQQLQMYGNRKDNRSYIDGLAINVGSRIQGTVMDETGEELIGANVFIKGSSTGTTTDFDGKYTLDLPPNANTIVVSYIGYESFESPINSSVMNIVLSSGTVLEEVVVVTGDSKHRKPKRKREKKKKLEATKAVATTTKENTISVEFKIEIPYTIPSDGKRYVVEIKQHQLPAYYEYYCAPKLDKDVFLTAQVTAWEEFNLLNGEVNLFFEGTYLGKSYLNAQNVQDTLSISLGRDKNIVVERTKLKEFSRKKFLSSKKIESRAWKIAIRNKKKESINLVVMDQFPISTNKKIEVKKGKYDGATLEEKTGFLTWKIKLAPRSQKELAFDYAVKYPKKEVIILE